jgi:hypothetical protein
MDSSKRQARPAPPLAVSCRGPTAPALEALAIPAAQQASSLSHLCHLIPHGIHRCPLGHLLQHHVPGG